MQGPHPLYSVVVVQKVGVLCKSCRQGIEIDDDYIPGLRTTEIAAQLYQSFQWHFPRRVALGSVPRQWEKTLTCGSCASAHTYTTSDLCLFDEQP